MTSGNSGQLPLLIVITGPTGSGKTDLSITVAKTLGCDIISADSRQIFRGIPIGTAVPSPQQLKDVRHHFVETLDLDQYYSAAMYEAEVMALLPSLWQQSPFAVMCGGSMMYIDAVCRGIDDLPTISPQVRSHVMQLYESGGLTALHDTLSEIDPQYLSQADPSNHRRLIHAIEITMQAGTPYSSLRTGTVRQRPFQVMKFAIDMPRPLLFDRINRRVDAMMEAGLLDEARRVYPMRHLNSLNTVGYKELFASFDGTMDLPTAVARIAKNTRVYAKKQLTWLQRDPTVIRITPETAARDILQRIPHH
ncbi:MAG: tRNA (adenosine(37)-N6)-dimethylallyltransferase MiaA [Muribaculaceae bacterium]|nr:tRNA (adenosine(37)-N6)-dimethylallyltransferase MiaA [Muribaculaceae bacterium]